MTYIEFKTKLNSMRSEYNKTSNDKIKEKDEIWKKIVLFKNKSKEHKEHTDNYERDKYQKDNTKEYENEWDLNWGLDMDKIKKERGE